ncbi:MAG: hypothetical protein EOO80_15395 [Oxalobacteraceae bacterium]|nr:MAG: hypothetical protein EOO80_15395 [Oxalobacteraceae bacterium]
MNRIVPCPLPEGSLLSPYQRAGSYADCYTTRIDGTVSQARYVAAFYTTRLFKLERLILRLAVSRPSTDSQALQLAHGQVERFAAWTVEARDKHQLLLCDLRGRTRSWLMTEALADGATCLYFGSAVVPVADRHGGPARLGGFYRALLGFHRLYSKLLLRAARSRLLAQVD